jgi:hypothetical protein
VNKSSTPAWATELGKTARLSTPVLSLNSIQRRLHFRHHGHVHLDDRRRRTASSVRPGSTSAAHSSRPPCGTSVGDRAMKELVPSAARGTGRRLAHRVAACAAAALGLMAASIPASADQNERADDDRGSRRKPPTLLATPPLYWNNLQSFVCSVTNVGTGASASHRDHAHGVQAHRRGRALSGHCRNHHAAAGAHPVLRLQRPEGGAFSDGELVRF